MIIYALSAAGSVQVTLENEGNDALISFWMTAKEARAFHEELGTQLVAAEDQLRSNDARICRMRGGCLFCGPWGNY